MEQKVPHRSEECRAEDSYEIYEDESDEFFDEEDELEPFVEEIYQELDKTIAHKVNNAIFYSIKLIIDSFIFRHNLEVSVRKEEEEDNFYFEVKKIKDKHSKIQDESIIQTKLLITKLQEKFPFYNKILNDIEIDFINILNEKLASKNQKILDLFNFQESIESNPICTLLNKTGRPNSKALDAFIIELRELELKHFKKHPYSSFYQPIFLSISKHHPTAIDMNDFNSWDKLRSRIKYIEEKKISTFSLWI